MTSSGSPSPQRQVPAGVSIAVVVVVLALGVACSDGGGGGTDATAPSTASSSTSATEPAPGSGDPSTGEDEVADLDLDATVAGFSLRLGSVTEATPGAFEVGASWTNLEEEREAQVLVPTFVDVAGEAPISVVRTNEVVGPQQSADDVLTFSLPDGVPLEGAFLRFGDEDQEAVRIPLTDPAAAELGAFDPIAVEAPAGATGSTFGYGVDDVQLRRDDLFRHEQAPLDARILLVTLTATVLDDGVYGTGGNILPAEQELVLADGTVVAGDGGLGVPIPFSSNLLDGTTATGTLMFVIDGYQPGPVTLRLTADDPAVEIPLELP